MPVLERFLRRLSRAWLRLRHWRAVGRGGASSGPVVERVAGMPLVVLPSVFNPRLLRSGAFLAESLSEALVPLGSRVLDLGTGSGVGALASARWASGVVASDVNPEAVRAARINALLNGLEDKIDVREGDLFVSVGSERFDVVLFNPPYFRGAPEGPRDEAWRSPDLDRRFAEGLGPHLTPEGSALLCLSTDGDLDFLGCLASEGYGVEVVAERDLLNEVLRLYRARRRS